MAMEGGAAAALLDSGEWILGAREAGPAARRQVVALAAGQVKRGWAGDLSRPVSGYRRLPGDGRHTAVRPHQADAPPGDPPGEP